MNGDAKILLEAINKLEKEFAVRMAIDSERHEVNQKNVNVLFDEYRDLRGLIKCSEVAGKVKSMGHEIKFLQTMVLTVLVLGVLFKIFMGS